MCSKQTKRPVVYEKLFARTFLKCAPRCPILFTLILLLLTNIHLPNFHVNGVEKVTPVLGMRNGYLL
jgi:hypothetical protein